MAARMLGPAVGLAFDDTDTDWGLDGKICRLPIFIQGGCGCIASVP
jgi:hypothetical protein